MRWLVLLVACSAAPPKVAPAPSNSAPPPKPIDRTTEVEDPGHCPDQVGCLLADDPPPCCVQYDSEAHRHETVPDSTPDALDAEMIRAGLSAVTGSVQACGGQFPNAKGVVKVIVVVAPSGAITSVVADETPDAGLGACVAQAVGAAHFEATVNGGRFKYPYQF